METCQVVLVTTSHQGRHCHQARRVYKETGYRAVRNHGRMPWLRSDQERFRYICSRIETELKKTEGGRKRLEKADERITWDIAKRVKG